MSDRPEPRARIRRDWLLIVAASMAPLFWLGQLMLGYFVSAGACYPGDHPASTSDVTGLRATMMAFDAIAIAVAVAAGLYAAVSWRMYRASTNGAEEATRFLSLWASLATLIFLAAILFSTITSMGTPLCS